MATVTTDFGIDCSILAGPNGNDLDGTGAEQSSVQNLLQDIFIAVSTSGDYLQYVDGQPAPCLFWEDPPVSFDLGEYVNDSVTYSELADLPARIERIYEDDPRFSSLAVDPPAYAAQVLSLTIRGVAATGETFSMSVVANTNGVQITATQVN